MDRLKNIPANIVAGGQGYVNGKVGELVTTGKRWKTRFSESDEFLNWLSAEWQKLLFIAVYALVNIGLFAWNGTVYWISATEDGLPPFWVMMARGFGQVLNFNCALILLPIMRSILTILRSAKLGLIAPLDKNITFHRYIAYNIVIFSFGHGLSHYFNYACCPYAYFPRVEPNNRFDPDANAWKAAFLTKGGLTGNLLWVVMIIMYSAANKGYRSSKNFTVFWYTHHLFIAFYVLLLVHGTKFWMWFLGPGFAYLLERVLRNVRGASFTVVKKVHALPSRVVHLELDKPSFRYRAGQYAFLNVPLISKHEWHPFTISSAPEEPTLQFHIRCVGDWTNALLDLFNPANKGTVAIDRPTASDGKTYLVRVDGPFGTCADHVYDFQYVMLIAAGIGVTPYTSLLKHLHFRRQADRGMNIKHTWFYWMNRDGGSWEWFVEMLGELETKDPDFFTINTFFTGQLNADQAKTVMYSSEEVSTKSPNSASKVAVKARAMYDYEPQASDEIQLHANDIILVEDRDTSGWWKGKNTTTNQSGLFPSNYVVLLDTVTNLSNNKNRNFGRPMWDKQFDDVRQYVVNKNSGGSNVMRPKVGVFICGPAALSKSLRSVCMKETKNSPVQFVFHKENF